MIVGPMGEIIYQKEFEPDIFTYSFKKGSLIEARQHFPFLKDADNYIILNKEE
jgi:predicted amidohydrolase